MDMEVGPKQKIDLEEVRQEMRRRIAAASQNPIEEESLNELNSQTAQIEEAFARRAIDPAIMDKKLEEIFGKIIESSALASNLIEFKILMEEMRFPKKIRMDLLEHENAHMNVAEQTGHRIVGYALVFVKVGRREAFQPCILVRADISRGPKKYFVSTIMTLQAPEKYGNTLSPDDIQKITEMKRLLSLSNF